MKTDPYDEIHGDADDESTDGSMSDGELCALIDRERTNGIGFNDQMQSDRERAMSYYQGEAVGELAPPEVEGRSRVVSKELMDVVEWTMPGLMEMFASTDDVVAFEPSGPAEEKNCKDATRYCGYVLHRKNPGFTILHDAIKSALITRMGVVKAYCDRSWDVREQKLTSQSDMDLEAIKGDDTMEIVEVAAVQPVEGVPPVEVAPGQFHPAPVTYDVTVRVKQRKDKFVVCGVPPEEITISKDSRDIETVRYIGHDVERTKSDLLSMGYDEEQVEALYDEKRANASSEASVRGDYDGVNNYDDHPADKSQRKVTLTEAYLLVDYDKDGIAEYRRVVKAGMVVFENEIVEDHPFALFTPILMPYKLVGMSFYDLVEDLQRIMTAINRQMLDNFYLSNTPRTEIVEGQVNLDDFLNPVPGGAVRVKAPNMMREIMVPSIAAQAMQGIEYFKAVRDGRTGVKEFSQGLVGDELSKSNIGSQGVSQLMDQAATRQKLLARVFAETGIKRLYRLILKMVTQYQDRQEQVKVNGSWMAVDPREWANNYDMVVSVGIGTQSKQVQVAQAMQLLQIQQQAAQASPGLVTPTNAFNTLEDLTSTLGKSDVSRYFTAPDPNAPPAQAPDPNAHKMAEIQANAQIKRAELQQQGQLQAQKQQGDVEVERMKQEFQAQQSQQETQLEAQRNQMQAESEMTLAREKASLEFQLAMAKAQLAHQTAIEVARINAEAKILSAKAMGSKDATTADEDANYQEAHENDA